MGGPLCKTACFHRAEDRVEGGPCSGPSNHLSGTEAASGYSRWVSEPDLGLQQELGSEVRGRVGGRTAVRTVAYVFVCRDLRSTPLHYLVGSLTRSSITRLLRFRRSDIVCDLLSAPGRIRTCDNPL